MKSRPLTLLLLCLVSVPFVAARHQPHHSTAVVADMTRSFAPEASRSRMRMADIADLTTTTTVPPTTTTTTRPPAPPPRPRLTTTIVQRPRPVATTTAPHPVVVVPAPTGDVWYRLRMCESHGDYTEDTHNGFYGAYQFEAPTWQNTLENLAKGDHDRFAPWIKVLPNHAPPDIQDAAARAQHAVNGWKPWPGCSRKLGLR